MKRFLATMTKSRPSAGVPYVCFGTALRAGGAPPRPSVVWLYVCFGTALRAGGAPPRPSRFVLDVCFGTALRAGGAPPLYPAFCAARSSATRRITEGTPSPPYLLWASPARGSPKVRGCRRPGEVWRGGASPSVEPNRV